MDAAAFEQVDGAFQDFHAYFAPLFGRREARDHSRHYLQALLVQSGERRNAENLSETVPASARVMQRFLTESPWDDDVVIGRLRSTWDPGWGTRRGCGCWTAAISPSRAGSPWEWPGSTAGDWARWPTARLECSWPTSACRTGPGGQRALSAGELDLGHRPLCGGWGAGRESELPVENRVGAGEPAWTSPEYQGIGRPRQPRLVGGQRRTMVERSAELPEEAWREITVAEGSQGPRSYQFSAQRVRSTSKRKPGEIHWAVYRRNRDGSEPRYYLSNAPEDTSLETLAYVGGSRRRIETEFETEKSDVGLDEYETRTPYQVRGRLWAGWHHHVALCLLGGAFLLSLQQAWGKKMPRITRPQVYRVVREMLPRARFGPAELLRWLEQTQECNERARRSHAKRRAALHASSNIPP